MTRLEWFSDADSKAHPCHRPVSAHPISRFFGGRCYKCPCSATKHSETPQHASEHRVKSSLAWNSWITEAIACAPRAIQFLALLIEQVPGRMVAEREKFESLFRGALEGLQASLSSVLKYHRQLDQRLAELPEDIATGISPDAIAGCINESLRQQFASSTLPETAKALAYVARNMKTTATEFGRTASSVAHAYRGSAAAAGRAISDLESAISRAAASARHAADDLTVTFHRTYRWALYTLAGLALFAGILFGMLLLGYLRS